MTADVSTQPGMRGEFRWFTVDEIATPRAGLVQAIRDCWWPTRPDGKVAVYLLHPYGTEHPQCNSNPSVVNRMKDRDGFTGEPVLIPLAFTNHRCDQ